MDNHHTDWKFWATSLWLFVLATTVVAFWPSVSLAKDLDTALTSDTTRYQTQRIAQALPDPAERRTRVTHAQELLGRFFKQSAVRVTERVDDVRDFVRERVKARLPRKWKKRAGPIAQAILDESKKHNFDPVFALAVIQAESSFRPDIKGPFGEIGLMQLRPETAEWISEKLELGLFKGDRSLRNPVDNVKLGLAYFSYLREKFDAHGQLYIAAYNMGSGNVNRALERDVWPKDYPTRIMKHYVALYKDLAKIQGPKKNHAKRLASVQ